MSRHAHIKFASQPRSSLSPSKYAVVDSILKDLKTQARRLQATSEAFRTEYRVLERIYYKGKNQHRSALFWKRVAETRRYCQRLDGVQIDELVSCVRRSFFCEDGTDKLQSMKGSWTHFPNATTARSASRRLQASSVLLVKMQERLEQAYKCLGLHMQNGAFLQLILTLAAIVSRLKTVAMELHANVCKIIKTLKVLEPLQGLDGTDIDQDKLVVEPENPVPVNNPSELIPDPVAEAKVLKANPHRVVVERKTVKPSTATVVPNVKKKKIRKDEIDDIFGGM